MDQPVTATAAHLAELLKAIELAASKHRNQRRMDVDASPYINHPLAVASLLAVDCGVHDIDILCAAVLHDTLENTQTTDAEIAGLLNSSVADLVLEVTNDNRLPWAERRQAQIDKSLQLSHGARLIKLANICCVLSELLMRPPADWPLQRKRDYFDWAECVVARLDGTDRRLQTRAESLLARRDELY